MIPLKDENPTITTPYVTVALIIVNCVIYLYQRVALGPENDILTVHFGAIPYEVTRFTRITSITAASPVPVFLTPFTSIFFHGGIIHLASNMLFLWVFGNNVEDRFGHARFLAFYLICGTAASVTHVLSNIYSMAPLVGASGAIAGVLGAYLIMFPKAKVIALLFIFIVPVPAVVFIGYWFIIQILNAGSQSGNTAWFAHIGGFLMGMILTGMFAKRRLILYQRRKDDQPPRYRYH